MGGFLCQLFVLCFFGGTSEVPKKLGVVAVLLQGQDEVVSGLFVQALLEGSEGEPEGYKAWFGFVKLRGDVEGLDVFFLPEEAAGLRQ